MPLQLIVNAAAYTAVDKAEAEPSSPCASTAPRPAWWPRKRGAKARRPPYSVLDNAKLPTAGIRPVDDWHVRLAEH